MFGFGTSRHSGEMSAFGWGGITVELDLLGLFFRSALNPFFTGSLSSNLLTHIGPFIVKPVERVLFHRIKIKGTKRCCNSRINIVSKDLCAAHYT